MKKFLIVGIALMFFMSCGEDFFIKGILKVSKDLGLKNKKGEIVTLKPANYDAHLGIDYDKMKAYLKVNKDVDGNYVLGSPEYFYFTLPNMQTLNGEFSIMAETSGQNYDFKGAINRETTESSQQVTWDQCVLYYKEIVHCVTENGKTHCHVYQEPVYGHREIRFHYRYYKTWVDGKLVTPGSQEEMAQIHMSDSTSTTINDYSGPCVDRQY